MLRHELTRTCNSTSRLAFWLSCNTFEWQKKWLGWEFWCFLLDCQFDWSWLKFHHPLERQPDELPHDWFHYSNAYVHDSCAQFAYFQSIFISGWLPDALNHFSIDAQSQNVVRYFVIIRNGSCFRLKRSDILQMIIHFNHFSFTVLMIHSSLLNGVKDIHNIH